MTGRAASFREVLRLRPPAAAGPPLNLSAQGSRALAAFVLAFTSACASPQPRASFEDESRAIAADLRESPDQALIEAHPGLLRREGGTLIVAGQRFTDQGDCNAGDCTRYRADAVWHGRYVGVQVSHYEDSDYILTTGQSRIPIGSRPIPSPGGGRFFTGHHDDRDWTPFQGASVWEWQPHVRRLRIVDTDLVMFDSFRRWHGDACVEFTGSRGFNVGLKPPRTFWLVEEGGDWQLREEQPPACR